MHPGREVEDVKASYHLLEQRPTGPTPGDTPCASSRKADEHTLDTEPVERLADTDRAPRP